MKDSLHEEIISLADQISKIKVNSSVEEYYNLTVELYEKVILLKNNLINQKSYFENELENNDLQLQKKESVLKDEDDKNNVKPLIETIKEMIPEMPENNFDPMIMNHQTKSISFEKKDVTDTVNNNIKTPKLNDHFAKLFRIDVNDRSAFINKLFDDKAEEYEIVMKKISSIQDLGLIKKFIYSEIKPQYGSWKDNLHIEKRFFEIIKKQFN